MVLDHTEESTDSEEDFADSWDKANSSKDEEFDLDVEIEDFEMVQRDHCINP